MVDLLLSLLQLITIYGNSGISGEEVSPFVPVLLLRACITAQEPSGLPFHCLQSPDQCKLDGVGHFS